MDQKSETARIAPSIAVRGGDVDGRTSAARTETATLAGETCQDMNALKECVMVQSGAIEETVGWLQAIREELWATKDEL